MQYDDYEIKTQVNVSDKTNEFNKLALEIAKEARQREAQAVHRDSWIKKLRKLIPGQ